MRIAGRMHSIHEIYAAAVRFTIVSSDVIAAPALLPRSENQTHDDQLVPALLSGRGGGNQRNPFNGYSPCPSQIRKLGVEGKPSAT